MRSMTNLREMTLASSEDHEFHICDARTLVNDLRKIVLHLADEDRDQTPGDLFELDVPPVGVAEG